jgi:hypothetical protein
MSGVYTNLAKQRAEQNKSAVSPSSEKQISVPSPTATQPTIKPTDLKMSTKPQNHFTKNSDTADLSFEKPEKYTTHLEPSLIKKLKIYATERDMKDYQVVKNALLLYFEKNK